MFVACFRSEESYNAYIENMPWLRIPFAQEERRQKLARALDVQAIPTLVILDPRDNIITLEGRTELLEDPEGLVNQNSVINLDKEDQRPHYTPEKINFNYITARVAKIMANLWEFHPAKKNTKILTRFNIFEIPHPFSFRVERSGSI